ncbi:hypothetical protein [Embleya sp. NPDC001921]
MAPERFGELRRLAAAVAEPQHLQAELLPEPTLDLLGEISRFDVLVSLVHGTPRRSRGERRCGPEGDVEGFGQVSVGDRYGVDARGQPQGDVENDESAWFGLEAAGAVAEPALLAGRAYGGAV